LGVKSAVINALIRNDNPRIRIPHTD
jgi:hypothetical protein